MRLACPSVSGRIFSSFWRLSADSAVIALAGQFLFGVTHYGRSANLLYYFKYVEGSEVLFTSYSLALIVPSVVGAAAFPFAFRIIGNKGRTASLFSAGTGISMIMLYFFNISSTPILFYGCAIISHFFFCGFNTAIYAIVPDCVEYGEWKTGIRNDGFQYAFVSLGNKVGMAIGTALLASTLGVLGFAPNQVQNTAVQDAIHHAFSTIPGILWIITAIVLLFYRINKKSYNDIIADLKHSREAQ
jgi:Na+/melibiose symporter-like transporter